MYSPSSPPLTGPTVKTAGWGSGLDMWLARGWRIIDFGPVRSAVVSKRKVTGLLIELDRDWDRGVGTKQLKDSMSPYFTTPVEGSTDKTGGGKEGMKRVGVASGEGRGKWNNYQLFLWPHHFNRFQSHDNANNLGLPQLLAKRPPVTVNTGSQYTLCLMFVCVCGWVCGFHMKCRM